MLLIDCDEYVPEGVGGFWVMACRADLVDDVRGFPPALTSFIGRGSEVDRLIRLLVTHRLVSVVGPGGVGKTRLAAEVTRRVRDRFESRIWLVELAAISAPQQLLSVIESRLGVQEQSGRSPVQAVAEVLAGAQALLVLDNCEHVVEAVAAFCSELLNRCDDVVILTTSREQLGVTGEARLRLRPLTTRTIDGPNGDAAGVALFLDRVRLADPLFELSADSAELVPQIVRRLDGLPLAIELAAARVEFLGIAQLHTRLATPLRVLTQGPRGAPGRQRSLRATVDWSYQLLSDPLRRVFRRLAILAGPFTLEAAEAVAGKNAESAVGQLVDCSLLTPPRIGTDGRARYLMLETLRAFALDQLGDSIERDDAESAMLGFAIQVASAAAVGMRMSRGEAAAAGQLDDEDTLLREAMSTAVNRHPARALPLAVALAPWWQLRGRALTGYPLLARAVDGYPDRGEIWLAAQVWLGRLAHSTAAYERALAHFSIPCASGATIAPSRDFVDGLAGKSGTLRNLGRLAEADEAAHEALHVARQMHYAEGEALALTQLSLAAGYADDAETATRWALLAVQVDANRVPDKVARRVQLIRTVALSDSEDLDAAREACAAGLESARAAGDVTMQADFLFFATHIALREEKFPDAGTHLRESMRLTATSGDSLRILDCIEYCARLCAATGRPGEAITLWAAHEVGQAALGTPSLAQDTRHRRAPLLRASQHLGPNAVRAAEYRGTQMNLQTAAEFAAMLASSVMHQTGDSDQPVRMTPREKELIVLVARGRTDAQIAEELFISIRTVRSHLDRIRDKTGSRRRADLTMLALRAGLL